MIAAKNVKTWDMHTAVLNIMANAIAEIPLAIHRIMITNVIHLVIRKKAYAAAEAGIIVYMLLNRMKALNKFNLLLVLLLLSTQVLAQQQNNIYSITFSYDAGKLSIEQIKQAVTASDYSIYVPGAYKAQVVSANGRLLGDVQFLVPQDFQNSIGKFRVFAPRSADDSALNIYDNRGKLLLHVELQSPTKAAQQQNNKIDFGFDFKILYIATPVILILGFLALVEVRRRNDHTRLMAWHRGKKVESLKEYISINMKKGFKEEQIRNALYMNGYGLKEIEDAFKGMK